MNEPLISVALCTYNGAKYIDEQLKSIAGQSHKNIEVIIVDDVSSDGTFEIIRAWSEKDARIKCYRNDTNLGFNKNFEKAISLTTGDYIAISDQDDIWLPDKLQLLLDHIGSNWLIFSNSGYIGSDRQGMLLKAITQPLEYRGLLLRNYITGHTTMMTREFLNFVLPFPGKGYYDWWMGLVAAYHHKITFYDKVLTHYRIHDESVIKEQQKMGKAMVEYENITAMLDAFSRYKNLKPEDKDFIKKLDDAYKLKASGSRSVPLMKLVYRHYHELFPSRKAWKSLTKPIFAFKYSKGLA
ncbi:MAG: glycosyltransferase family 2 protein [Mucilaginibacter sp.]